MLLAIALQQIHGDVRVFSHADDIVIFARTRKEADLSAKALCAALKRHPAGPLEPKFVTVRRAADGFRFLGYWFKRRHGSPTAKPLPEKFALFRENVRQRLNEISATGQGADALRSTVRSWFRQYQEWPRHGHWCELYLRAIDNALAVYRKRVNQNKQQGMPARPSQPLFWRGKPLRFRRTANLARMREVPL
jgi:hypothetical protein